MLGKLRKFSTSIYAKILLGIIIIPFVFWGMGSSFRGGSQNIIVEINDDKFSSKEFIYFVKRFRAPDQIIDNNLIEDMLSRFIGEKLIKKSAEELNIVLSKESLSKLIKNQELFKRENKFSRTEYEKFLIENGITAPELELNISDQEKRRQLIDLIGGGLSPPNFLVNLKFNQMNQKRDIELINLDNIFNKELNFTEDQIKYFFDKNKERYITEFKTIKFIELSPKNLIGENTYTDLYFKKIDEIDDLIVNGTNLDSLVSKFNLGTANKITFDSSGNNRKSKKITGFPEKLINNVFNINKTEPVTLIEHEEKFFIIELANSENVQKDFTSQLVKKEILKGLEREKKRSLISEIVDKINKNNFNKVDFDIFSKEKNLPIKKILLDSIYDESVLKKNLVTEIYKYPEKKVILVTDISFKENFLIYINKIKNTNIDKNSEEYNNYSNLSRVELTESLYKSYDSYIKNKYKIDINYQVLDSVKNYFIF